MSPIEDINADFVIARLQAAMLTMATLPSGWGPGDLKTQSYGYVADVCHDAMQTPPSRFSASPRDIDEMDEAIGWLRIVANPVVRRIVAMRSVVNRETRRPILSWGRIGKRLHCSHEAARNWYASGIDAIVDCLRKKIAL